MNRRNALVGFGAALLLLIPYYSKFLLPSNSEIFHLHLPISNVMGGLLVDLLFYSVVMAGFLIGIERLHSPLRGILGALFSGLMVWNIVDFAFEVLIHLQYRLEHWERIWGNSTIGLLLIAGTSAYFLPRATELADRVVRALVAGFAFTGIWIVPQLLHIGLAHHLQDRAVLALRSGPRIDIFRPRVVWILFDELSYDQTFDHRAPGIQLPNFARLRAESSSFNNLKPVGFYTDRIIPSLFSGQVIYEIRSTIEGKLQYKGRPRGPWIDYDPDNTVFALARRNGWKTGIEGWFNPYCRIFGSVADVCSWEANLTPIEEYGASEEKSVLANAAVMPSRVMAPLRRLTTPEERQIQVYHNIMENARALIDDNEIRFVFVHIPVPHGPGIYDRSRHMFRSGGNYLDRLVLADDTLGTLMADIGAMASAGNTTVIVSSDHSWRIQLSRNREEWTEEEERASGGRFDERPVLLVRFPNRPSGQEIQTPLPEMLEHRMIVDMLLGKINNPDELNSFISQQAQ